MGHYPVVLAEHDAAYVRYFPKLTKRRRNVLTRINDNAGFNLLRKSEDVLPHGVSEYRDTIHRMSTRTLEMALDEFNGSEYDMSAFLECADRSYRDDEMLLRFMLSYRDSLKVVITEVDYRGLWTDPNFANLEVRGLFRTAKSAHREFFRYEDPSAMPSATREQFEAIVIVLAKNFHRMGYDQPRMSATVAELIMDRPERAYDILTYQADRGIALNQIKVKALTDYLDAPVTSLSSGVL